MLSPTNVSWCDHISVACRASEVVTSPRTVCHLGLTGSVYLSSVPLVLRSSYTTSIKIRAEPRICSPGVITLPQLFLFKWEAFSNYNNEGAERSDHNEHLRLNYALLVINQHSKKNYKWEIFRRRPANMLFPTLRVAGVVINRSHSRKMIVFGKYTSGYCGCSFLCRATTSLERSV